VHTLEHPRIQALPQTGRVPASPLFVIGQTARRR
jgi:hypothetical protein